MENQSLSASELSKVARRYAEEKLNGELLEHTRGCAETAAKLARRLGLDEDKAVTVSYLHDIAKPFSKDRQAVMARELGMSEAEIDSYPPAVLHGPLAALIVRKELGIEDAEIAQAIAAHSTGCAGMSGIGRVVFVADYIEESRIFPGADELRSHGHISLNELTIAILRRKLNYLIEHDKDIDPRAIDFWNELMNEAGDR